MELEIDTHAVVDSIDFLCPFIPRIQGAKRLNNTQRLNRMSPVENSPPP